MSTLSVLPEGRVPETVREAYDAVLHVANYVLRLCKLFSIESLREENPTISDIARSLHMICEVMELLARESSDCDPLIPVKAKEYADHIRAIAEAVDTSDNAALNHLTSELNKRSFL